MRALILAYRRWCSGRGPLRFVGCSFAHTESCSAYGLRAIETAPSAAVALRRIRARLRRCREASVYVVQTAGARSLAWGCCHDEPEGLDAELAAVDELPRTRYAVVDASRKIAAYRGRGELAARLQAQLDSLGLEKTTPRLLLRRGDRLMTLRARRLAAKLLVCLVAALAILALTPWPWALIPAALVLAAAGAASWRFEQRRHRFDRLLAAAAFSTAARVELRGL